MPQYKYELNALLTPVCKSCSASPFTLTHPYKQMELPPSTQPPANVSPLFHHTDGSPFQIYVEASNIQGRPQLVRSLKKYGASICHDPKSAQILLVDPESIQGKLFIRNWGHDEDKVVLDHVWARKCIEAEKALLEDDRYGECLTYDDGLPIGNHDDGGEEQEQEVTNPLPTPRQTPIEPPKFQPTEQNGRYPIDQQTARRSQSRTSADSGSSRASAPPSITPTVNGVGLAGLAALANPIMPPGTQVPQVPLSQQQAQAMIAQQAQAAMMQLSQSGLPFPGQQQPSLTDPFWLSMQDNILMNIMQNHQLIASLQQGAYSQPMPQPVPSSPVPEQALPFPSIPQAGDFSSTLRFAETPPKSKSKYKQRAASPSSKRRKTSTSSFQEGSSARPKTNGSSMGPPSAKNLFIASSGTELKFYVQIAGHNRFNLVRSIKQNGGAIVNSIDDANYVVLFPGAKNDKAHDNYLRLAKSARIPVVTPRFVNECVEDNVLLDPEAYLFEPTKKKRKRPTSDGTLHPRDRSPIEPESEDESDSAAPPPSPVVMRMPDPAEDEEEERERKRQAKCDREKQRRDRLKAENEAIHEAAKEAVRTSQASSAGISKPSRSTSQYASKKSGSAKKDVQTSNRPRSPTPPAMHTKMTHGSRGYRFSAEEDEFALRYAKVLLERDHEISASAVTAAIFKKLPHHTVKSWRTHFPTIPGNAFDEWRKRAGIAYRKAQNSQARQIQSTPEVSTSKLPMEEIESEVEEPPPSATCPSPAIAFKVPQQQENALEDDLNVIARFFADGGDDQTETEDVIWARLTKQVLCRTQPSWEDFYQLNSEEVQKRYQMLVDQN